MNKQEFLSICHELITTIKSIFPQTAEIETQYNFNRWAFECTVLWPLNNDINRPYKPSRIILIAIPKESIMNANYEQQKLVVHERFKKYIQNKYAEFNPNHDEPLNRAPPTEEWLITSDILCH